MKTFFSAILITFLILVTFSCYRDYPEELILEEMELEQKENDDEQVHYTEEPVYFPQGMDYDLKGDHVLVSSITWGDIGQVTDGEYTVWVNNENFVSTLGFHIDHTTKRVFITNTDLDGSLASFAAYDLSGRFLFHTDLADLKAGGNYLNDVAADRQGNAYITDSYAGIIYKVDPKGEAEIFLDREELAPTPPAFGMNGIDYDPRGFLLVGRADTHSLLKIPLDHPENYTEIKIAAELFSPDGLHLKNPDELLVVSNDFGGENSRVQTLKTKDGWETASLEDEYLNRGEYFSTVTVKRNAPYIMSAHLDILLSDGTTDVFRIFQME